MTGSELGRDELIKGVAKTVADYRTDDGVKIEAENVSTWVEQFDVEHRTHVLRETHAILQQRYVSKEAALEFLQVVVTRLSRELAFGDPKRFLAETAFLSLQAFGKSQGAMLELLGEIVKPLGFSVPDCGGDSPKRYIYLDDVLCTGNRFYYDLKDWWMEMDESGRARQDYLSTDVDIIPVFIAVHELNLAKVQYRFQKSAGLKARAVPKKIWRSVAVQNKVEQSSALDLCFPRRDGAPPSAEEYLRALGVEPNSAFRPERMPAKETLFTSSEGRDAFEHAVLGKGLEIIGSLATHKPNMHPLGFTLPSQKSLGFGALVFTWRNVPNNSPLVFWHNAPAWSPLFEKNSNPFAGFEFSVE